MLQKHVSSDSFFINKAELFSDIRFEVKTGIPYILPYVQSTEHMGYVNLFFSEHFYVSDRIDIIYILYIRKKVLRMGEAIWQDLHFTSG